MHFFFNAGGEIFSVSGRQESEACEHPAVHQARAAPRPHGHLAHVVVAHKLGLSPQKTFADIRLPAPQPEPLHQFGPVVGCGTQKW